MKEYNDGTKTPQNEYVNRPAPLEALERIKDIIREDAEDIDNPRFLVDEISIIETALKEYELMKEIRITARFDLAQVNKEHKALEIIKETRVDANLIKLSKDYDDYCGLEVSKLLTNMECPTQKGITEEEFDLLKEVLM